MSGRWDRQGFTSPWLVILAVLGFGVMACGGDTGNAELNHRVELAITDSAGSQMSEEVRTEGLAEVVTETDQAQPPPEPEVQIAYVTKSVRLGAELSVELLQELSTKTNRPGDKFIAAVIVPLIEDNMVVVPVNSLVRGEVTAVQASGGNGQEEIIKIRFINVMFNGEYFPMSASVVEVNSTGEGVVAGSILGRVIGGNTKGTVIGAAVGVAAGTAITLETMEGDAVLTEGSILRLRLDEMLVVRFPQGG